MRFVLFSVLIVLMSCDKHTAVTPIVHEHDGEAHSHAYKHKVQSSKSDRYSWQKPAMIIDRLGDVEDKVVADIGASTGYFTFRLAKKDLKSVIAVEIDQEMLDLMGLFKENLDSTQQARVDLRLATPSNAKLRNEEVDKIIIINTIGYIENRRAYIAHLLPALKPQGQLLIVDFKMKSLPLEVAPPPAERVTMLAIEDDLLAAGFTDIDTDDSALNYQYIISATKP